MVRQTPEEKARQEQYAKDVVHYAIHKIETSSKEDLQKDMKQLVTTLLNVLAKQEPALLDPTTPENKTGKLFFTMLGGICMDAMNPFMKEEMKVQFAPVLALYPLMQKYSTLKD